MMRDVFNKQFSQILFTFIVSLGIITTLFYRNWFQTSVLTGGDWGFLYKEQFSSFPLIPQAWESLYNLGNPNSYFLWATGLFNLYISTLGKFFNITILSLIGYYLPFLIIGIYSIQYLYRKIFNDASPLILFIGSLIYMSNSYILMIVGGGQILIGLAYSFAPLVIARWIDLIKHSSDISFLSKHRLNEFKDLLSKSVLVGLCMSVQVLFDLRIALVTILAVAIYSIMIIYPRSSVYPIKGFLHLGGKFFSIVFLLPIIVVLFIHAFWLIPTVLSIRNPAQDVISAISGGENAATYFSFASFENTISLVHPNWPENIFGLTRFFSPEYLLLPLLSFSSLLFLKKFAVRQTKPVIFSICVFGFIALVGAFLAKGAQPPLGGTYIWLYNHVPGFFVFRDATKFYLLIAISYSLLIPFTLDNISLKITSLIKDWRIPSGIRYFFLKNIIAIVFISFWLFSIRQSILAQLSGTFQIKRIPQEYVRLKDLFANDRDYFRTFWIPQRQRFGYFTLNHPSISAASLVKTTQPIEIVEWLKRLDTREQLARWSVKYIIVPLDSEEEIYLTDRRYDERIYRDTVRQLDAISWLDKLSGFEQLAVYRTRSRYDHLWSSEFLQYQMSNPTHYVVSLGTRNIRSMLFSESFDPAWVAKIGSHEIYSRRTTDGLNSFDIGDSAGREIVIEYKMQRYVTVGLFISMFTIIFIIGFLFKNRFIPTSRSYATRG